MFCNAGLSEAWAVVKCNMTINSNSSMDQTPNRGKKRLSDRSLDGIPIGKLDLEGTEESSKDSVEMQERSTSTSSNDTGTAAAQPKKRMLRKHNTADEYGMP